MSDMHDPLDDLLRETLEGAETAPAPDTWSRIRRGLGDQPRRPYRFLLLALFLLVGSLALYQIISTDPGQPKPVPNTETIPVPVVTTSDPKPENVTPPPVPVPVTKSNQPTSIPSPQPILPDPVTTPVRTEPISLTIPVFLPDPSTPNEDVVPEPTEPVSQPVEPEESKDPIPPPAPKGGEPQSGKKTPGILGIIAKGADVVMGDMVDYKEKEQSNGYDLKVSLFGKKINISKN